MSARQEDGGEGRSRLVGASGGPLVQAEVAHLGEDDEFVGTGEGSLYASSSYVGVGAPW